MGKEINIQVKETKNGYLIKSDDCNDPWDCEAVAMTKEGAAEEVAILANTIFGVENKKIEEKEDDEEVLQINKRKRPKKLSKSKTIKEILKAYQIERVYKYALDKHGRSGSCKEADNIFYEELESRSDDELAHFLFMLKNFKKFGEFLQDCHYLVQSK